MMDTELLRDTVRDIMSSWGVPGCAVVVSDHSGPITSFELGVRDPVSREPVSASDLFEIGSISKLFTATVVLSLVEDGRLRLSQPVGELLPWLPEALHDSAITIERLLTHTAGLVQSVDALPDEVGQASSYGGVLAAAPTGSFFHYSNLGYILLGLVCARVGGRPMPELVQARVLDPLKMMQTVPSVTHDHYDRLARGTQPLRDDRPFLPGDALVIAPWLEVAGSDGSIAATADDLARFGRMLLSSGSTPDGVTVLAPASFAAMIERLAPGGEDILALPGVPPTESSRYGLGVNVERTGSRLVLTHGGGMVGYASFLLADLTSDLTVAVVTNANGDSPVAEAIARTVAAQCRDGVRRSTADPHRWDGVASPEITAAHVGVFVAPGAVPEQFTVTREADGLAIAVDGGQPAPLTWTWSGRAVTALAPLRRFGFTFDDGAWLWGPDVYRPAGVTVSEAAPTPPWWEECTGHYRTYSPWFTNFRVVLRGGQLVLIASGGVEAPGEDMPLVPTEGRTFRIGADPRNPERITFAAAVDGQAPTADRDGCRYSRSFTP